MPDCAEEIADLMDTLVGSVCPPDQSVPPSQWRTRLIDIASCEMARVRGVSDRHWRPDTGADSKLARSLREWPDHIWRDPHALGWLHEQYAAVARHRSFADHVHREKKHVSATVSTQLYTPRWIADFLAREAMALAASDRSDSITVCDPAVGGGQMLLAALDQVVGIGLDDPMAWVAGLWGSDLDGRAVEVARRTLALEVARRVGERNPAVEDRIDNQIVVADALDETLNQHSPWSVVLTNPPYMGWRSMPASLREALDPRYRPYHHDLFSAFIARCHELADGAVGILAQQSIWYLRRYEKARRDLLSRGALTHFMHLGAGAFWNLDGEKANVVAFVQDSGRSTQKSEVTSATQVWDLRSSSTPQKKRQSFDASSGGSAGDCEVYSCFEVATTRAIPGRPICHDLPRSLRQLFSTNQALSQRADIPGGQNKTGRNREYVRRWDEVDPDTLRYVEALGGRGTPDGRWVFYSKGGRFAPWWGNWEWVVDWAPAARAFYRENRNSNLLAERYWFRQGIVYTDFGGQRFNARWMPPGCVYDMTGPAIFPNSTWWPSLDERQRLGAALAVLNSSPARRMLRALNPTLHFQVRDVRALPLPGLDAPLASEVAAAAWRLIEGVQRLHRQIPGDPLAQASMKAPKPRASLAELRSLEATVDAQICDAYGVAYDPIDNASIAAHHALG